MIKRHVFVLVLFIITIPVVIYFYFLKWKTGTIYGDDISIFFRHAELKTIGGRINLDLFYDKLRPVHGLVVDWLINVFQKNLEGYYLFNVFVQSVNTFLFAIVLNLFLRNAFISLLLGSIAGLTRFSFFNITQLFNGGALEGLALSFFLLSLYFILTTAVQPRRAGGTNRNYIIAAIFFANLATYTHERYIVMFLFIVIFVLFFWHLKLSAAQKIIPVTLAIGSVALNFALKKYFALDFFVGTSGTRIEFSLPTAFSFLTEALLSIFQVNSGPSYLTGIGFGSLPVFNKVLIILLICGIVLVWVLYLIRNKKNFRQPENAAGAHFTLLFFLSMLFALTLAPAIVTIRLEQRWLQAPLCIAVLINAIVFKDYFCDNGGRRAYLPLVFFGIVFLWSEYIYLYKGADRIYMAYTERTASSIKRAVSQGIIRPATRVLIIGDEDNVPSMEEPVRWTLGNGEFFRFYQYKDKKIIFGLAGEERSYYFPAEPQKNFNTDSIQVITIDNNSVSDGTGRYIEKLFRHFPLSTANDTGFAGRVLYNQKRLLIANSDFDNFNVSGFYGIENGIRWTTGNARIGFIGNYTLADSLTVVLTAHMIPAYKNINPAIIFTDNSNREYKLPLREYKNGQFVYRIFFDTAASLKSISILSATIDASPDKRTLSFPFISLEIRK